LNSKTKAKEDDAESGQFFEHQVVIVSSFVESYCWFYKTMKIG